MANATQSTRTGFLDKNYHSIHVGDVIRHPENQLELTVGKAGKATDSLGNTYPLKNDFYTIVRTAGEKAPEKAPEKTPEKAKKEESKVELKETLRRCKRCGRDLPLASFRKHKSGQHIFVCNECLNEGLTKGAKKKAAIAKAAKEGKAPAAAEVPVNEPPVAVPAVDLEGSVRWLPVEQPEEPAKKPGLSSFSDEVLAAELRRRGWSLRAYRIDIETHYRAL